MIHKFIRNNMNIVLDVNSSSIHIFDEIAFDIVEFVDSNNLDDIILKFEDKYCKEDIKEAYEELNRLRTEGTLFSKSNKKDKNKPHNIKALCLNIAHDCNIRCSYCFASQGNFKGENLLMKEDIGKKAIDFLIKESGNRRNLEIDFFGGEPLLNFDVVKNLVEYGKSKEKEYNKNFRFTLTTNCIMLDDDNIDFINDNMDNIVLSLDGRKEINDNMRYTPNNKGTYDLIIPKIKKFIEKRGNKSYFVRGTFTSQNKDFHNDVIHMHELGFKNLSVEPVVADESEDYAIKKEDVNDINKSYEKLTDYYLESYNNNNRFNFFHYQLNLDKHICQDKKELGCGAGIEYVSITPEGDIYPCHQFVGDKKFIMGNLNESDSIDEGIKDNFKNLKTVDKEECDKCWAKNFCSGGCHANAYNFNNDLKKPYTIGCELEKKRLEESIYIEIEKSIRK